MSILRSVVLAIGLGSVALACGGSDKKEDTTPATTEEAAPAEGEAAPAEGETAPAEGETPPADDTGDTGGGAEGGGAEGGGEGGGK
jgi:hypothetical protein